MAKMIRCGALLSLLALLVCGTPPEPELTMTGYKYFLILPGDYDSAPRHPFILFLHGRGGAHADAAGFYTTAIGDYIQKTPNFPFIVLAPQTPLDWSPLLLKNLLDQTMEKYAIDPERMYLTGYSMGGAGTWSLAMTYPDLFAALAPICGYASSENICSIAHIPEWIFHNEGDPTIEVQYSQDIAAALDSCGAEVRTTFYPDLSHDAWTAAYHTPELYEWFLSHKLERP